MGLDIPTLKITRFPDLAEDSQSGHERGIQITVGTGEKIDRTIGSLELSKRLAEHLDKINTVEWGNLNHDAGEYQILDEFYSFLLEAVYPDFRFGCNEQHREMLEAIKQTALYSFSKEKLRNIGSEDEEILYTKGINFNKIISFAYVVDQCLDPEGPAHQSPEQLVA